MADCTHEGVSPVISDKKFMRSNVIQHLHTAISALAYMMVTVVTNSNKLNAK